MDIERDRILGLSVYNDATLILHVIGVYMPYFNGETEQIQLYAETLDLLQSTLRTCAETAPVIVMGDLNCTLPNSDYIKNYK